MLAKWPAYGVFVKDGKGYLLIDLGEEAAEHRWLYTVDLIEVVVRFWRDFFRLYLSIPELPASRHHVDIPEGPEFNR